MTEQLDIPAAMRAQLDRELSAAVNDVLDQAADRDGLDVIEASHGLACRLSEQMTFRELAMVAAALAIRLRRTTAEVAK